MSTMQKPKLVPGYRVSVEGHSLILFNAEDAYYMILSALDLSADVTLEHGKSDRDRINPSFTPAGV
jgi:hypothetical protein